MRLFDGRVRSEWIDYNGHLYDGYYAVIFANATDEFLVRIGLDGPTREATRHTIYTLEMHVSFLKEMKLDAAFSIDGQILDHDHKRVRLFLTMHDVARDLVAATCELMLMSIDQSGEEPRSAPWLAATAGLVEGFAREDAGKPMPETAGRAIAIRRG